MKFLSTQVKFVTNIIAKHINFIEDNVKRVLSGSRKNGPFTVNVFDRTMKVDSLRAQCEYENEEVNCQCRSGVF